MPSISEPCSPQRGNKLNGRGKWTVNSCSDITDQTSESEDGSPIKIARWKALRSKRTDIAKFIEEHKDEGLHMYIDDLRHFATSRGGLVEDEFRSIIWPILANDLIFDVDCWEETPSSSDSDFESALSEVSDAGDRISLEIEDNIENLKLHKEWNQVQLDVHRTLARFPPNISEMHRSTLQDQLTPLIVRILSTNPKYNYYQGFHDVCLTLLLVVGLKSAYKIGVNLAKKGAFNAFLIKSMEDSVVADLDLMYVILNRTDPELERAMRSVQLGCLFALSWPLTWFSHSLQHYHQIVRCFDLFLASQHLAPIYVAAAVVMYRRASVLSVEREMPFMHQCLNNMPHELPIDELLSDANYIAKLIPPTLLRGAYFSEYRQHVQTTSIRQVSKISRYALQLVVTAGAASAAAGYLYLNKYS